MSSELTPEAPQEISCDNCVGACCRAPMLMTMTTDEAYWNRRQMKLERQAKARDYPQAFMIAAEAHDENGERFPVPMPIKVPAHHGLYLLTEDCGNLTTDKKCAIYNDKNRPGACAAVEVGSAACLLARAAFQTEIDALALSRQPD